MPDVRLFALVAVILSSVGLLGTGVRNLVGSGESNSAYVFFDVTETDLPIVVTERGELASQVETTIACSVENIGDRGSSGTQIIHIVPNGSAVGEGELLVEFDSATIRDRLEELELSFQKAKSARIQAEAKYDNQILQNQTAYAEAVLARDLAKIELDMYKDPSVGKARLEKEAIDRLIDEAKNKANEARAQLELAEVERDGMKELFKLGYRGKRELETSRLDVLRAEDSLASSLNQIKTYRGERSKLDQFDRLMEEMRLKGAWETADRNIKQVENDNKALLDQALAAKTEAINTEAQEMERLERIKQQLVNCKIVAPHPGMVVYKRERRGNTEIMEGAFVRERQEILSLPDLSKMKVKTQVHEAVLDQIRPGLPASVRIDAFPERTYRGVVEKVGVVPSSNGSWFSSGSVKTYETEVRLVDEVEGLKPGMTAVVNVHVDTVENVLAVPVQSIIQNGGDTWCYVEVGSGVLRKDIEIGRSNDKFVHIQSGLSIGDRVVLNSIDIYEQENDGPNEISAASGVPDMPESLAEVGFEAPQDGQTGKAQGQQGQERRGPEGERQGVSEGGKAEGRPKRSPGGGGRPAGGSEGRPAPSDT